MLDVIYNQVAQELHDMHGEWYQRETGVLQTGPSHWTECSNEAAHEAAAKRTVDTVFGKLFGSMEKLNVDFDRLHKALSQSDDWGGMVHAFEYLTVLGVVETMWRQWTEAQSDN